MAERVVIIPTYNEIENISNIIDAVLALPVPFHILIVDDGSPDGTANVVKSKMEKEPRIHILERSGKLGLGSAYLRGFEWSLENGFDYICEMDADFSHNPKDLVRLYECCSNDGADMAIGSRYVKGGNTENWPFDRWILSYGASFYVRMITWMPVKDPTAGFVCYTSKVLSQIDFAKIKFVGYAFQIEMKFATRQLGFKLKEIPITFTDRIEGVSKMSKGIIKEAVFGVIQMKWRSFFRSYRRDK